MIFKRNYTSELIDDFSIRDERIDLALQELKIINKFLGGNKTTKKGLKILLQDFPPKSFVKILDAGSGTSDILRANRNIKLNLIIYGIDLNIRTCKIAKLIASDLNIVCGNISSIPFKPSEFDVVHASLFLHHFNEKDIQYLLMQMLETVKYGIIINDLRRSVFAFLGIKLLTKIFSKSKMVKNDAPLSVKRGFIKRDLINILNGLNIKNYEIKKTWAFRWLVIIRKNN